MFSLNRPEFLLLGFLVPLYYVLRRTGVLSRIEFSLTLGDWNGIPFRWSSPVMKGAQIVSRIAAITGVLCIVIAMASPVRYRQEHMFGGNGTGIVFALDVSPSMAARDLGSETRLDTARHFIHGFMEKRSGDSFGLVALGSDAALMVPPTTDHVLFGARLDALSIGELGDGTALGLGLAVAAAHLMNRADRRSCVILLTDGENNTGDINPKTAAGIYPDNDIRLFVVGIGTRGQVPVEYTDPSTGKLYSGVLDSDYSDAALRAIADRGGGTYVQAGTRGALESVFAGIGDSVPSSASSWTRTVEEPLERPMILAALALLAMVWFLRRVVMGAVL